MAKISIEVEERPNRKNGWSIYGHCGNNEEIDHFLFVKKGKLIGRIRIISSWTEGTMTVRFHDFIPTTEVYMNTNILTITEDQTDEENELHDETMRFRVQGDATCDVDYVILITYQGSA